MARLFRRRATPDELFFLTPDQAEDVRAVAKLAFGRAGATARVSGRTVELGGRTIDLEPLALAAYALPRTPPGRARLAEEFATRVLADQAVEDADLLTVDEIGEAALAYVVVDEQLSEQDLEQHRYLRRRRITEGLYGGLAFDLPEATRLLHQRTVDRCPSFDELYAAAVRRLEAFHPTEHQVVSTDNGVDQHVLRGESVFTSSSMLALDLIRGFRIETDPTAGYLLGMPSRQTLCISPLRPGAAKVALEMMAWGIPRLDPGSNPLSRDVFWAKDKKLRRVTEQRNGTTILAPPPELVAVLDDLDS